MISKKSKLAFIWLHQRLKKYPIRWLVVIVILLLYGASDAVLAYLPKLLIDNTQLVLDAKQDTGTDFSSLAWLLAGFCLVFFLFRAALIYLRAWQVSCLTINLSHSLRRELTSHLVYLPQRFFDRAKSGHVSNQHSMHSEVVIAGSQELILVMAQELIKTSVGFIVMFVQAWQLGLMVLLIVPVNLLILKWIAKFQAKYHYQVHMGNDSLMQQVLQILQMSKLIKAQGGSEYEINRFTGALAKVKGKQINLARWNAFAEASALALLGGFFSIMVFTTFYLIQSGDLDLGSAGAFYAAFWLVRLSITRISQFSSRMQQILASVNYLQRFLYHPKERKFGTYVSDRQDKAISFRKLSIRYPNRRAFALRNVSFEINSGEVVAVIGHTGSGKSTLLSTLLGFVHPNGGEVLVDNTPVHKWDIVNLRKQIAYLMQDFPLHDDSVKFNITYPDYDHIDEARLQVAIEKSCAQFVYDFPDGLDTMVGEGGRTLSGGEKSRIALARSFYREAQIVLLDEATSSLDVDVENQIMDVLKELLVGKTAIIVTHRLSMLQLAHKVIILSSGKLLACDTPENLAKNPAYAKYFKSIS